jgi:hypothetical protein
LPLARSFKIVNQDLKNPGTKHWQRAFAIFDLPVVVLNHRGAGNLPRALVGSIMIFDAKQKTAKIDDHHGVIHHGVIELPA